MRTVRIIADLPVTDIADATDFYADVLGLEVEDLGLYWVRRLVGAAPGVALQLVTRDATAPESPALSVAVDDVDTAYARVLERGDEVVHPLTDEPWGVRRFFVRSPDGTVLNVVRHRD